MVVKMNKNPFLQKQSLLLLFFRRQNFLKNDEQTISYFDSTNFYGVFYDGNDMIF